VGVCVCVCARVPVCVRVRVWKRGGCPPVMRARARALAKYIRRRASSVYADAH
jgi:hypothetical protein